MRVYSNLLHSCTMLIIICCLQFEADTQTQSVPSELKYAGYVVFRNIGFHNITYLLLKRKSKTNQWILPKGAIEPEEFPSDTANRVLESITNYTEADFVDLELEDKPICPDNSTQYFIAYITSGDKEITLSSEYEEFIWLHLKEACEYADKLEQKVISEADEFLKSSGFYL